MIEERTISIASHGRYLVCAPGILDSAAPPAPLLVGFHGYAEPADLQLTRLRQIPGADRWLLVSVQAPSRFYRGRSEDVVASWMTRQDRELAIVDNLEYVSAVVGEVSRERHVSGVLVFAGFSQGVAMAFRAACLGPNAASGVLALGGDIPPELDGPVLGRCPSMLIGRGERDDWYTAEKLDADEKRLRAAGVAFSSFAFDGGHEWGAEFSRAAGEHLARFA